MGFFDRFVSKPKGEARRAGEARRRELDGDLDAAAELYEKAALFDDAARVLLLAADVATAPGKRIAMLSRAAELARDDELKRRARGRKARVSLDVLRGRAGAYLKSEVLAVARELEEVGELEQAADAYALAGDDESEVRALTAAGAIDRLEERLRVTDSITRRDRDLELLLRRVADLDRTAERRAALDLTMSALEGRDDPRVADAARSIRARLVRGPVVDLEIRGVAARYALGADVTIGRGDATIVVASPAVSRRHLVIRRAAGNVVVEDLATRNGTLLAGARMTAPLPLGRGVRVELGGEVPCVISPPDAATGAVSIEVAGVVYTALLGALDIDGLHVDTETTRDESFVVLSTPDGVDPPYLGDFQLAKRVELAAGDEIRRSRGGPVLLRVPMARESQRADDGGARARRPE